MLGQALPGPDIGAETSDTCPGLQCTYVAQGTCLWRWCSLATARVISSSLIIADIMLCQMVEISQDLNPDVATGGRLTQFGNCQHWKLAHACWITMTQAKGHTPHNLHAW
jgi:hypothetical protein